MKLHFSVLTAAIVVGVAFAQGASSRTLDEMLTQDEGMAKVSEGLYASASDSGESYVAVNAKGQEALLQRLLQIREAMAPSGATATATIDDLIARMQVPPKPMTGQQVIERGDCNGESPNSTGPFYAVANAGGPMGGGAYGASGTAVNNDTSGTAVNTTNVVQATVYDRNGNTLATQTSTQHKNTAAVASAYAANSPPGCVADASATLTCPGKTSPSVAAYAMNHQPGANCVLQ